MSDQDLLTEGGVAGHMNHLYDNPDLTFAKLKEIFDTAAEGKLEGTEKTDGQNLMVSFSVKDGRAKGVRNKSEVKSGGLNPEQLAAKFADRANPALKETFADALKAFERAVQSLSHEEQIELFGPETNIFYNAEVMDPRTPNVINYDTKALVIHRAGHFEFDRKNDSATGRDLSKESAKLEKVISDSQEQLKQDKYGVQVNAVKKLKGLSDKKPLNTAKNKINSLLAAVNSLVKNDALKLGDDSTVGDYMTARVYILINSILQKGNIKGFDPVAKMNIAKRILGVKGISVKDISTKISKEQLEFAKENLLSDTSKKEILKTAILPLESIVSDFAVEMLKGLQSAFVLDNSKEVQRLKGEVRSAINAIESSGNEEAMSILKRQMSKLRSADNVDAAAEGFVFDYDGVTYKFTGNFAPVNQILGLFKYGRGNVPPLQKLEEAKQTSKGETIAVIPGGFKPPQKAHLEMAKFFSKMADKVKIFIGIKPRNLPDGKLFTADMSKKIWDIYISESGLNNVEAFVSDQASPFNIFYEIIANKENNPNYAQPGQTILLGRSNKDKDLKNIQNVQKYAAPNVEVRFVEFPEIKGVHATDLRNAIAQKDEKEIIKSLPKEFNDKKKKEIAKLMINLVYGETQELNLAENIIYDIINETIVKRGSKYCLISKKSKRNLGCYDSKSGAENREKQVQYFKHAKEENMSAGAVQGATKPLGAESEQK